MGSEDWKDQSTSVGSLCSLPERCMQVNGGGLEFTEGICCLSQDSKGIIVSTLLTVKVGESRIIR